MKQLSTVFVFLCAFIMCTATADTNLGNETVPVTDSYGSIEVWTPGICMREFPEDLRRDFPIYLSGYDFENRPVLFWEVGKFQFFKWAVENSTTRQLSYDYFEHIWCRIHNLTSPLEEAEEGVLMVFDSKGLDSGQFFSIEVSKLNLAHMRLAEKYSDKVAGIIVINTSLASQTWVNIIKPVAGRLVGSMELTGNRKEKWLPILRGKMENSVIPPWITGEEGRYYKPLEIW